MAFTPTAGMFAKLSLSLVGGVATTVLPGTNWKFNIDAKTKDVSNFRDGRARVGTLEDSDITMTAWHDQSAPDYLASGGTPTGPNVVHAITGTAQLYVDTTHYYSVGVIVSKIGAQNEGVEGVVSREITLQQNGTLTYPTG